MNRQHLGIQKLHCIRHSHALDQTHVVRPYVRYNWTTFESFGLYERKRIDWKEFERFGKNELQEYLQCAHCKKLGGKGRLPVQEMSWMRSVSDTLVRPSYRDL